MCGICISRRGMVYFGASIHIFVTFVLLMGSLVRLYRISSYGYEETTISKQTLGAIAIASYFFVLFTLGGLIFRGVEKKSPRLLGWSGGAFITLETFAFVFNLILLSPMGGSYDEYGLRNFGFTVDMIHILLSFIFLFFMVAYCVVIILYICKLRDSESGSNHSDCTYGDFDDVGAPAGVSAVAAAYFTQQSEPSVITIAHNTNRRHNGNNVGTNTIPRGGGSSSMGNSSGQYGSYEEHWEQPRVQALTYNKYGMSRSFGTDI